MTEVVVYDALCGSGKTTKIREYMLENKDTEKFIYISPFLKESYNVAAIDFDWCDKKDIPVPKVSTLTNGVVYTKDPISCLNFKYPDRQKGRGSKETSLSYLMSNGYNITSTHQLFTHMSINSLDGAGDYTLIIDEALSVFEESDVVSKTEVKKLLSIGILQLDEDGITLRFDRNAFGVNDDYDGDRVEGTHYENLATMCDLSQLLLIDGKTLVWEMSADMLKKFKRVIICTYLFEGQVFASYLKKHDIEYTVNRFGKKAKDVAHLFNVLDDVHLNSIGAEESALCSSFFSRQPKIGGAQDICRKHLNTVMRKWGATTNNRLFTCFVKDKSIIADGRYTKNWIPFTSRATNDYGHVENIAYFVNVYPSPIIVKAANGKETKFDTDIHSLGELLQFLFRGCVRNGREMNIYIPSMRMRKLLVMWLDGKIDEDVKKMNLIDSCVEIL